MVINKDIHIYLTPQQVARYIFYEMTNSEKATMLKHLMNYEITNTTCFYDDLKAMGQELKVNKNQTEKFISSLKKYLIEEQ